MLKMCYFMYKIKCCLNFACAYHAAVDPMPHTHTHGISSVCSSYR